MCGGPGLVVAAMAPPGRPAPIPDGTVNPVPHTEYLLQHDGVVYRLAWTMLDRRNDDWLSTAEGIESLAAEG